MATLIPKWADTIPFDSMVEEISGQWGEDNVELTMTIWD
jgi:hypothetical protein